MTDLEKNHTLEMWDSGWEQWTDEIGDYNAFETFEEAEEAALEFSRSTFQEVEFDRIEFKITNTKNKNEFKIFTIRDTDDRLRTFN